jgi:hypothetical protein
MTDADAPVQLAWPTFIANQEAKSIDTMKGKLMLAWYQSA